MARLASLHQAGSVAASARFKAVQPLRLSHGLMEGGGIVIASSSPRFGLRNACFAFVRFQPLTPPFRKPREWLADVEACVLADWKQTNLAKLTQARPRGPRRLARQTARCGQGGNVASSPSNPPTVSTKRAFRQSRRSRRHDHGRPHFSQPLTKRNPAATDCEGSLHAPQS